MSKKSQGEALSFMTMPIQEKTQYGQQQFCSNINKRLRPTQKTILLVLRPIDVNLSGHPGRDQQNIDVN